MRNRVLHLSGSCWHVWEQFPRSSHTVVDAAGVDLQDGQQFEESSFGQVAREIGRAVEQSLSYCAQLRIQGLDLHVSVASFFACSATSTSKAARP